MAFNLFGKSKKKEAAPEAVQTDAPKVQEMAPLSSVAGASAYRVLRSIYTSEKASSMAASNQYVFMVSRDANKEEIKKQVGKLYGVTVTDVRVLNMPRKRKDLGRHPGFRSGFRKAVVRLAQGQTISQATP